MNDIKAIIEALLFVTGEPLAPRDIAEVLSGDKRIKEKDIMAIIEELKAEYAASGRSFSVEGIAGGYRLHTLPQYEKWIARLFKQPARCRLSQPALETLAIVAYRQPITRVEIERIRGVNVDGVLRSLMDRELIMIRGRKPVAGRPFLYLTTKQFLEHFGLKSQDELPMVEELRKSIEKTEETTLVIKSEEDQETEEKDQRREEKPIAKEEAQAPSQNSGEAKEGEQTEENTLEVRSSGSEGPTEEDRQAG